MTAPARRPSVLAPRTAADLARRLRSGRERGGSVERNGRRWRARVVVDGQRRTVGTADAPEGAGELLRAFHASRPAS